tara:strand:- start:51 stop:305 length:255 start_codon:yes stop_codon:yes gene_type:complete
MDKFKLIQLLNKVELAVGETVMSKKIKEHINELILDVKNEAINYTRCCKSDSEQLLCKHCDNKKVLHSEATGLCPDRFKHFEAK